MSDQNAQLERRNWQLPFGFFAGPILWGLQILVGYGLVTLACTNGNKLPVYLTVGIAGLIVLAAGALAYQAWNARNNGSILMDADEAQESSTFWAVSGFAVSTLFFLLILTTAVAAIFLSPCPIITMPLP
jgi:hypothetical protein